MTIAPVDLRLGDDDRSRAEFFAVAGLSST